MVVDLSSHNFVSIRRRARAEMAQLTDRQKYQIVEAYGRLGSIRGVQKELGFPRKTCRLWIERHSQTQGVKRKAVASRKRVLDDDTAECALDMLRSKKFKGAQEVAIQLQKDGKTATCVHRTTLISAARRQAQKRGRRLRAVRGKPKAKVLGQDTVNKRLAYCKEEKSRNWGNVLFTDRCKFAFKYPGCVVPDVQWLFDNESKAATMKNHAEVFNAYGGISIYGTTKLVEVAGTSGTTSEYKNKKGEVARNITSNEYADVLSQGLLKDARGIFAANGHSSFFLMQDNDPTHKVAFEVVQSFNRKNNTYIIILKHPPNSPDFNPIENVWSYVASRVNMRGCKTFNEFKDAVREEFRLVPIALLKKLIKSMPRRMAACVEAKGQRTKY